jgi:uncharacterized membrane protein YkvA (DUF1232 family)
MRVPGNAQASVPVHAPEIVPRPRSAWRTGGAILGAALATAYILNPTMGVFELLPDVIPGIGNLDEAAATALLIACVRFLRRPRTA